MPRLGVPSTTDSARVMADVCGEPAPLPRSTNPRHNDRPGGTFPRVVQRLIETSKKGRKEGAWRPPPGAKAPPSSGRAMVAVSCPAPISNERKLSPRCNPDGPGRPREAIDFLKLPPRAGGRDRASEVLCRFRSRTRSSPRPNARPRDCARPRRNPQDLRGAGRWGEKSPCGSTFEGITRIALLVGPDAARSPASGSKSRAMSRKSFPQN